MGLYLDGIQNRDISVGFQIRRLQFGLGCWSVSEWKCIFWCKIVRLLFIWLQHLSLTSGHKWQDCIQWHANIRFLPDPDICHISTHFKIFQTLLNCHFQTQILLLQVFQAQQFPVTQPNIAHQITPESLKKMSACRPRNRTISTKNFS